MWALSIAVLGPLTAVAFLGAQRMVEVAQVSALVARGLSRCHPQALEPRLSSCDSWVSCSAACGILPDQGLNLCLLHWQTES